MRFEDIKFNATGSYEASTHFFMLSKSEKSLLLTEVNLSYGEFVSSLESAIPLEFSEVFLASALSAAKAQSKNPKAVKLKKELSIVGVRICHMLGKELVVLAKALEQARSMQEAENACKAWLDLRSEERWWMYTQLKSGRGDWLRAIYFALAHDVQTKHGF